MKKKIIGSFTGKFVLQYTGAKDFENKKAESIK